MISFHPQRFGNSLFQSTFTIYIDAKIAKETDNIKPTYCNTKFSGKSNLISIGVGSFGCIGDKSSPYPITANVIPTLNLMVTFIRFYFA